MADVRAPHVTFSDTRPSENEYFEVFNKFNLCNSWFVLIYILRSIAPFCLAIQTDLVDHPSTIESLFQQYALNHSLYNTSFFYEARCLKMKPRVVTSHSFTEYCERQRLVVEINICKNIGFSIGAILAGPLADIYGRRITSLSFSVLWGVFSWILVLMPTLTTTKLCFIAVSSFSSSVNVVTFVNFAEISNKKNRIIAVYTIQTYVMGALLLNYFLINVSQWSLIQAFAASSIFLMIFACWYIPESARWLWNKNKQQQAYRLLEDISGLEYSFGVITDLPKGTGDKNGKVFIGMLVFLVRQKLKFLGIFCQLIAISAFYYSCSKWNLILTFIHTREYGYLASLAEITSFLFLIPLYLFLGKRYSLIFIYSLLSVQSIAGIIRPTEHTEVYFNAFGTLLGICSLSFLWLYILEAFPTFVRATVVGICFCMFGIATACGIILVDAVHEFSQTTYYTTFLAMALLGGIAYFLPDLNNLDLVNHKLVFT